MNCIPCFAAGPWTGTGRHLVLLSPSLLSILGFLSNSSSSSASIGGFPGGAIQTCVHRGRNIISAVCPAGPGLFG